MRAIVLLACVALLSGCGASLRPDRGEIAINRGYSTAEIIACGQHWLGTGMCSVPSGSLFELAVQGYYSGKLRLVSRDCEIDQTLRYEGNATTLFRVDMGARRHCLFSTTVTPEYTRDMRDGIVVHSFRGHLAVRAVGQEEQWFGATRKVAGDFKSDLILPVPVGNAARVVLDGCGVQYDQTLTVEEGRIKIPLHEAVSNLGQGECVLDGFAINEQMDVTLNVLIDGYDPAFAPLPLPHVVLDGDKLKVTGDPAVSIVALDDGYVVDRSATFKKFEAGKPHILRLLTVNGRAVLGLYSPQRGWSYQQ